MEYGNEDILRGNEKRLISHRMVSEKALKGGTERDQHFPTLELFQP